MVLSSTSSQLDACGNGILEMGEVCDDGNAIDEDNCKNGYTSKRLFFIVLYTLMEL